MFTVPAAVGNALVLVDVVWDLLLFHSLHVCGHSHANMTTEADTNTRNVATVKVMETIAILLVEES